ncbi:MAG: nucleotidyltransferase domain-containing protein [Myxococcota bacterium]
MERSTPPDIRPHHRRTIERLAQAYRDDARFSALIIGGSVAKGYAREDSDVDFMLVATDQEYKHRVASGDLLVNRTDVSDYDGGYADGKVISESFLKDVGDRGNEPSRAAFVGAFPALSRLPDLERLLERIPVYPEADRDRRIKAFYCLAFMGNWLMNEATRHDNRYGITRAASQLSLFSSRLVLAHNRVLFPYHKWMLQAVDEATDKPPGFLEGVRALLDEPGVPTASALLQSVQGFRDWGVSDIEAYTWFMTEVEWSWMNGTIPMEDW